ncbi:hypothetical protein [Dickeya solani]|uniref:Lipoprotein n=1 Tax=Dickeya solani TaxID=1089444 RepID=A0ABU4EMM8_9GAMM|nr:hypothetical protein [Dickeya solani]MCA6999118.1 hypothetical protein [Dickeya solani]MCZ0823055.1 hypothetical protein [Dickeya solani]MDV6997066.1 hypothetical protein [Dickeya solani]MDV7005045.1 hypothetical protein [Dickeya solani]MDV7039161.1 hypothetical protein [Dickeya solani]
MKKYIIISMMLMSGCAVKPEVSYQIIQGDKPAGEKLLDKKISDSFYLASSSVVFEPEYAKASGDKKELIKYKVTVLNSDYKKFKIGIAPKESLFTKTSINITKVDNTDRVKDIGVDTEDNREKIVKEFGALAVAGIAFAEEGYHRKIFSMTKSESDTIQTKVVNIDDTILNRNNESLHLFRDYDAKITLGDVPVDAIPAAWITQSSAENLNKIKHHFIYASCRDAVIEVKKAGIVEETIYARVSDPRYVQAVALPVKGKVTTHSQCGVSVVTEKNSQSTDVAVLTALLNEIKDLKDAVKKQ